MTISERIAAARRERRVLGVLVTSHEHRYGVQFPERGHAGVWSAWPERVVGVAWPLAGLAALVSLGLPGVPSLLQLRGRGSGQSPCGRRRHPSPGLAHNGTATGDSELNHAELPPTVVPMWVDGWRMDGAAVHRNAAPASPGRGRAGGHRDVGAPQLAVVQPPQVLDRCKLSAATVRACKRQAAAYVFSKVDTLAVFMAWFLPVPLYRGQVDDQLAGGGAEQAEELLAQGGS